jgi:hypothetical protein
MNAIKLYNRIMSMDSVFRIFLLSFLTVILMTGMGAPVKAQVTQTPIPPAASPQPNQSMPPPTDEVTILRDDFAGKYNPSTLENLSKLYWRLGAFDLDDDMAVGNYLKINDCKIFTEYLNDDLEWQEIVRVMKDHIRRERDTYPLNYQFLLQLHLGRYDAEQGGFPLVDKTGFKDAKRIAVDSIDRNKEICYDYAAIKDYPKSLIILLPQPFTLDFIKMDEHVAQAYILRKKSEYAALDESLRVNRYERDAYLRLRVTFSQYHGNLRGDDNEIMAIVFGRIDGYEIFEDSGQKRLMVSVKTKDEQDTSAAQMSVPNDMQKVPAGVIEKSSDVSAEPPAATPTPVPAPETVPTGQTAAPKTSP